MIIKALALLKDCTTSFYFHMCCVITCQGIGSSIDEDGVYPKRCDLTCHQIEYQLSPVHRLVLIAVTVLKNPYIYIYIYNKVVGAIKIFV